jgi:hypothetical protein
MSSVSGQPISPIFRVQDIQKREQNATEVNLSLSLSLLLCPSSDSSKTVTFQKLVMFSFSGKETPNLGYPLD